ncbi:hypothetical protein BC830DRAFT_1086592, partial [Chytriomyces sp. MP71]
GWHGTWLTKYEFTYKFLYVTGSCCNCGDTSLLQIPMIRLQLRLLLKLPGLMGLRERGWTQFWTCWCNWQHICGPPAVADARITQQEPQMLGWRQSRQLSVPACILVAALLPRGILEEPLHGSSKLAGQLTHLRDKGHDVVVLFAQGPQEARCASIICSSMRWSMSPMESPWSCKSAMDSADGGMVNWLSVAITGDERPEFCSLNQLTQLFVVLYS